VRRQSIEVWYDIFYPLHLEEVVDSSFKCTGRLSQLSTYLHGIMMTCYPRPWPYGWKVLCRSAGG